MKMRISTFGLLLALLLPVPAAAGDEARPQEDPWAGMTRDEVVKLLGEPQKAKRVTPNEML